MLSDKEKVTEQIKLLKAFLPDEKKEGLAKILWFWEKYKKEWDDMEGKFWKEHNRDDFLKLISQYEESKQNFIKRLPPEERKILENIENEKFYRKWKIL